MSKVFLDTSYAVALSARTDQNHERALELAEELEGFGTQLLTTRAVLLEIGNALAKVRYREAAVRLLSALENDPKVEIVPASDDLYQRALEIYRDRVDKEWGLIDCMSFVVMNDESLTDVSQRISTFSKRALMRSCDFRRGATKRHKDTHKIEL